MKFSVGSSILFIVILFLSVNIQELVAQQEQLQPTSTVPVNNVESGPAVNSRRYGQNFQPSPLPYDFGKTSYYSLNDTFLFSNLTVEDQTSIANHLKTIKLVLLDLIALITNSLSLVSSSANVGTSDIQTDTENINRNLESFKTTYANFITLLSKDLVITTAMLNKIPGYGLIKFVLHVPITIIQYIKNLLYTTLVAFGITP